MGEKDEKMQLLKSFCQELQKFWGNINNFRKSSQMTRLEKCGKTMAFS